MTSLDVKALSVDPAGLEFLRGVLDTPACPRSPVGAFDVDAPRLGWAISATPAEDAFRSSPLEDSRLTEIA